MHIFEMGRKGGNGAGGGGAGGAGEGVSTAFHL